MHVWITTSMRWSLEIISLFFWDCHVSFIGCVNCNMFPSHVGPFGTVSRPGHPRSDGHNCWSVSGAHMHPPLHVSQFLEQQNKVTRPSKRQGAMLLTQGCKSRICLLLCLTLCLLSLLMCREVSGGLVPAAATTHFKRGGTPVLPSMQECGDSHELETLMSTDRLESAHLTEEASEDQRLMPSAPGDEEDLPPSETKVKIIKVFFLSSFFFF